MAQHISYHLKKIVYETTLNVKDVEKARKLKNYCILNIF